MKHDNYKLLAKHALKNPKFSIYIDFKNLIN